MTSVFNPFKKKLDMTKPHELSFGQLDPFRAPGDYAIRDGLVLKPRYTEERKMKVLPIQYAPDRDGRIRGYRLEPGTDWDLPAVRAAKKRR